MSNAWPSRHQVLDLRVIEAVATARRLGHTLCGWAIDEDTARSRCISCYEAAVVTARKFRHAPLSGAALTLRCQPKRKERTT